jgi:hypothetical protein
MAKELRPVTANQLSAARKLFDEKLPRWKASEGALDQLRERFPEQTYEAWLIKCIAINSLYNTNILAIVRLAEHVCDALNGKFRDDVEVVECVAGLAKAKLGKQYHRHTSFASKLCHFFVDSAKIGGCEVAIYDSAARVALKEHDPSYKDDGTYGAYRASLDRLRLAIDPPPALRDIDRYLWIYGSYLRSKEKPDQMNRDLIAIFQSGSDELTTLLSVDIRARKTKPAK